MGILDPTKVSSRKESFDSDKNPGDNNININNIVGLNEHLLFDLIVESHKRAYDEKLLDKGFENEDFKHLLKVVSKNLSGYRKTIRDNLHLVLKPLPDSRNGFHQFFEIKENQHDKFKMGYTLDSLVNVGDSCVYGRGFDGVRFFMKNDLGKIGRKAYNRSSNAYRRILEDRTLTELIKQAGFDPEIESVYYDKCADSFEDYVNILRKFSEIFRNPKDETLFEFIDKYKKREKHQKENSPEGIGDNLKDINYVERPKKNPQEEKYSDEKGGSQNLPKLIESEEMSVEVLLDDSAKYISDKQKDISLSLIDFEEVRERTKRVVIGQDEAIDNIIDRIILETIGAKDEDRPLNFLAIGPTGVGKNYTFEVVSGEIARSANLELLYRTVNCSSFQGEGSANQLVGSPKGYVGHEDDGVLTSFYEIARHTPLRVLLFDEFEKGEKPIMDCLLPALDKGGLYDNKDLYIDLTGTWIAFTSNLGYSDLRGNKKSSIGFSNDRSGHEKQARRESIENKVKNSLSPEFINRVNIVHFNYLEDSDISRIFDLESLKLTRKLKERYNLEVTYSQEAKKKILEESSCTEYGARFLKNVLESKIAIPLSRKINEDLMVDENWAKEMLDYLDGIKNTEDPDIETIEKSVKKFGTPKLPYDKLNVDFYEGRFNITE